MTSAVIGLIQAARIMRAALRTLAQCHARGILHRDIKPGNFLFHTTDEVSPIKAVGESVTALPSCHLMRALKPHDEILFCAIKNVGSGGLIQKNNLETYRCSAVNPH